MFPDVSSKELLPRNCSMILSRVLTRYLSQRKIFYLPGTIWVHTVANPKYKFLISTCYRRNYCHVFVCGTLTKIEQENIPVGCTPPACWPYVLQLPPPDVATRGSSSDQVWIGIQSWPPDVTNRQTDRHDWKDYLRHNKNAERNARVIFIILV